MLDYLVNQLHTQFTRRKFNCQGLLCTSSPVCWQLVINTMCQQTTKKIAQQMVSLAIINWYADYYWNSPFSVLSFA